MIEGLGDISYDSRTLTFPAPAADRGREVPQPASAAPEPIPTSPPEEVLDMLDAAARVLHELQSSQVSLHIEMVGGEAGNRIHVQVLDAEGNLLREIPPRQLLEVLAGTSRGLTFDELG